MKLKHQTKTVKISDLVYNRGQLQGLPGNPRFIRNDSFELMRKSIRETPGLLDLRPPIVYPLEGIGLLVIAGEMRSRAAAEEGHNELPVIILHKDTSVDLLREITIKDNSHFGEWDMEELANSWGDGLSDWGVANYWSSVSDTEINDLFTDRAPGEDKKAAIGDKGLYQTIVLSYHPSVYEKVVAAFDSMEGTPEQIVLNFLGITSAV